MEANGVWFLLIVPEQLLKLEKGGSREPKCLLKVERQMQTDHTNVQQSIVFLYLLLYILYVIPSLIVL